MTVQYDWTDDDDDYLICSQLRMQECKRRGHDDPPELEWLIGKEWWLFVAKIGPQIIGFCSVMPLRRYIEFKQEWGEAPTVAGLAEQHNAREGGRSWEISLDDSVFCHTLYLHPEHRRQLGAFKLYRALTGRLRARGRSCILFGVVLAEEQLVRLYRMGGAVELGREKTPVFGETIWMATPIQFLDG